MTTDKEVRNMMKRLNLTESEAIELINFDKMVIKNEVKEELSAEQKAVVKKMTNSETHKKTERKIPEKKIDPEKKALFAEIEQFLKADEKVSEIKILNPNREINFMREEKKFKIILSMPRK